ncbi:hypothetical protein IPH67_01755 [bacterium]|nr:MAG: hypothetical protein IPH67_01755 [bacterium]
MYDFVSYCQSLNGSQFVYVENKTDYDKNLFQDNLQRKQIAGQHYSQKSQVNTMPSSQKTDEKFIEWAKALIFNGVCLSKNYLQENNAEYIFRGQKLNNSASDITFYNESSLDNATKNEKKVTALNFTRNELDTFSSKINVAIQVMQGLLQPIISKELKTLRNTIENTFNIILDTQKKTVNSDIIIEKIQVKSRARTRRRGNQNQLGNDQGGLIYTYLQSLYELDTSYDNLLKIRNELLTMDFEELSIKLGITATLYESKQRYNKVEEFLKTYIKTLQDFLSTSEQYESISAFNCLLNNEWTIFTSFVNKIETITQSDNKNSKEKVAKDRVRFSEVGDNTTESEKLIEAVKDQSVLLTFFYTEMIVNVETKLKYFYERLKRGYIKNNDDFYDIVESLLCMDRAEEK